MENFSEYCTRKNLEQDISNTDSLDEFVLRGSLNKAQNRQIQKMLVSDLAPTPQEKAFLFTVLSRLADAFR